jgi:hypothetical protein
MKTFRHFVSAVLALTVWLVVGLIMAEHMSAGGATIIGFVAFWLVAVATYPKSQKHDQQLHR